MESHRGNVVFVFGAGASKAEGAPTSDELLLKSLTALRENEKVRDVIDFLKDFFFVDVHGLEQMGLPKFEEILTMIDIALLRQDDLSREWNYNKLAEIRNDLIYCIAKILDKTLRTGGSLHRKFVKNLFGDSERSCNNTAFINLNYDILLDNALIDLYPSKDWDVDYEIDFRNFVEAIRRTPEEREEFTQIPDRWHRPRKDRALRLLKPHGSLNWLYCPNCNTVKITKKEKGVLRIWTEFKTCELDDSPQRPLIVPPTWQKVHENSHLVRIWLRAAEVLRMANIVFFIGYSLPDSDTMLKYLFKKFLYHDDRASTPLISVVLKEDEKLMETKMRYVHLFGKDVAFMCDGFEKFVNDPSVYQSIPEK